MMREAQNKKRKHQHQYERLWFVHLVMFYQFADCVGVVGLNFDQCNAFREMEQKS